VAGWWPFHAPKNAVSWRENGPGLRLRSPAVLWSSANLGSATSVLRTIEIWLEPDRTDENGTVLAFETKPSEHFYVGQSEAALELQWPSRGYRRQYLFIPGVFIVHKPVLLTIVSGERSGAVYVDGTLKRTYGGFPFSASELAGRLVVGATPFSDDCWTGKLRGIALYKRPLSGDEVREQFGNWMTTGRPSNSIRTGVLALYLFDERFGAIARDNGGANLHLVMPLKFEVLYPVFLSPFWREVRFSRGFWEDVLLNIIGFVPFGFFLRGCLSDGRRTFAAIGAAVFYGFLVSLLIETVQVYLPTRSSDSTDLLTNTLGTLLGASAYGFRRVRSLYERYTDRILAVLNTTAWARGTALRSQPQTGGATRVASD
jgi:glycopeptide antibiotics resistance protein